LPIFPNSQPFVGPVAGEVDAELECIAKYEELFPVWDADRVAAISAERSEFEYIFFWDGRMAEFFFPFYGIEKHKKGEKMVNFLPNWMDRNGKAKEGKNLIKKWPLIETILAGMDIIFGYSVFN
jgi:hypothetical protein